MLDKSFFYNTKGATRINITSVTSAINLTNVHFYYSFPLFTLNCVTVTLMTSNPHLLHIICTNLNHQSALLISWNHIDYIKGKSK